MMRFRPLLAAAAIAGLLASGCDYWRNLVDEKTVATAHLKVKVIDDFTQKTLTSECTDLDRGLILNTINVDGEAEVPHAGTGMYTIRCKASLWYYDRVDSFPLTPPGKTVIFRLARLGEAVWYKDDTLREVRIREKFDTLRFPRALAFNAYPEDPPEDTTSKRFRYVWTFAKAKSLDQDSTSTNGDKPTYRKLAEKVNLVPGPDTLTLRVWSMMNDPDIPYYIGEYKRPFVWVRNTPPKFDTLSDLTLNDKFKVGCPDTENRVFRFVFSASDSVGTCSHVRLFTRNTNTSLGKVDTVLNGCHLQIVQLPLRNMFDSLYTDKNREMPNTLYATVYDDNSESTTVAKEFTTFSNYLPVVSASIPNFSTVVYIGEPLVMNFTASDFDGSIRQVVTNWGLNDLNHTHIHTYPPPAGEPVVVAKADTHIYYSPSRPEGYVISATAYDGCGTIGYASPGTVIVRKNTPPEIDLHMVKRDIQAGSLTLRLGIRLKDYEVGISDDEFTLVKVDWGDGTGEADSTDIPKDFEESFTHRYTTPPPSSAGYPVEITVKDAHYGGTAILDTLIAPP